MHTNALVYNRIKCWVYNVTQKIIVHR